MQNTRSDATPDRVFLVVRPEGFEPPTFWSVVDGVPDTVATVPDTAAELLALFELADTLRLS